MRILLQRVTQASVTVDNQTIGQINTGYCILLGIGHDDTETIANKMADKVVNLRVFNDQDGKFNLSLLDIQGHALVISQFTLYADAKKGRRPSFTDAAKPELASKLCDYFTEKLRTLGIKKVQTGQFAANMQVQIHNDGPVTIQLDSKNIC